MRTQYGDEIQVGTILQSSLHPDSKPVICIKATDTHVHLRHNHKGDLPIILNQETLDVSMWTVVGETNMEEED